MLLEHGYLYWKKFEKIVTNYDSLLRNLVLLRWCLVTLRHGDLIEPGDTVPLEHVAQTISLLYKRWFRRVVHLISIRSSWRCFTIHPLNGFKTYSPLITTSGDWTQIFTIFEIYLKSIPLKNNSKNIPQWVFPVFFSMDQFWSYYGHDKAAVQVG